MAGEGASPSRGQTPTRFRADWADLSRLSGCQLNVVGHCQTVHYIRIGKTGSSSTLYWLGEDYRDLGKYHFVAHASHKFLLGYAGPDACYTFFVRDPVDRWVSGFLSRYRRGCPDMCNRWREAEIPIFHEFPTPNALAEALGSSNETLRARALHAHETIRHTSNGFAHYLPDVEKYIDRILYVGVTKRLHTDYNKMCQACGLPGRERNRTAHHQNPPELEWMKRLSPLGYFSVKNLLKPDYQVLEVLRNASLIPSAASLLYASSPWHAGYEGGCH